MSATYDKFMKEVKSLQKEIEDINWELANCVLDPEEVVDRKILISRLRQKIEDLMQELPGLK